MVFQKFFFKYNVVVFLIKYEREPINKFMHTARGNVIKFEGGMDSH